jgi:linoleoyl-CoA desaturase
MAAPAGTAANSAAAPLPWFDPDTVRAHHLTHDCWVIIDGYVYDVSAWVDQHPGGHVLSSLAGEDVSVLFHSAHLRDVSEHLGRFRIGRVRGYHPAVVVDVDFMTTLKQRVLDYCQRHGVAYRQTVRLRRQVCLSVLAFALCWYLTYGLGLWPAAVLMGLIACALVGSFAHEYTHSNLGTGDNSPTLSAALKSLIWAVVFPFMPEKYFQYEHLKHHVVPMDPRFDYEVFALRRFLRLSAEVPYRWYFRYQRFYAPLVYSVYIVIQFMEGFFSGFFRRRQLTHDPALRFNVYGMLFLGGVVHVLIPIFLVGSAGWLLRYALFIGTWQLTTYLVAAAVHMTDAAAQPSADWVEHVCLHTRNVLCGHWFYDWLAGGFNYQIDHHLLPSLSRESLCLVHPIIRDTCREFGYPFHEYTSFLRYCADHYRYLDALGKPPASLDALLSGSLPPCGES